MAAAGGTATAEGLAGIRSFHELVAGRHRNIDTRAQQIHVHVALRTGQLTAPEPVAAAFAATTRASVGIITELHHQITDLETQLEQDLEQHSDADIYLPARTR